MHTNHMQKNCESQRHILLTKGKMDLFLNNLNKYLGFWTYTDNIDDIYHNFSATVTNNISKLSTEVLYKRIIELPTLGMIMIVKLRGKWLEMLPMKL